ncbi:MAG: hypothetical protein KDA21_02380 [Phycisphaerales bacterium]|nr:hypothetical protein [Phycisphaerales bacterium]
MTTYTIRDDIPLPIVCEMLDTIAKGLDRLYDESFAALTASYRVKDAERLVELDTHTDVGDTVDVYFVYLMLARFSEYAVREVDLSQATGGRIQGAQDF